MLRLRLRVRPICHLVCRPFSSDPSLKPSKKRPNYSSNEFFHYQNSIREIFKLEKPQRQPAEKQQDLLKENLELLRLSKQNVRKESQNAPSKKTKGTPAQRIKDAIKHAIHETIEGTKKCIQDYKFTKKLIFNKHIQDQQDYNVFEISEIKRIRLDFIKLVPFSVFLLIPLFEALLPPYILLFPNAFPTQYIPKEVRLSRERLKQEKQDQAHRQLLLQLKSALLANGVSLADMNNTPGLRKALEAEVVNQHLALHSLDSETLVAISQYMQIDLIQGTHILNTIYRHSINSPKYLLNLCLYLARTSYRVHFSHWLFKYEIKLNFSYLEVMKRHLLLTQITRMIQQMKAEDHAMAKFGIPKDKKHSASLLKIGQSRGFRQKDPEDLRDLLQKHWVTNANINFNDSQYVWHAVLNHSLDPNYARSL